MSKKKPPLPPEVLEYFREQGSKGGLAGGKKAWENMTPEEKSERAKRAAATREKKRRDLLNAAKNKTGKK